jgi:hypothetical protein
MKTPEPKSPVVGGRYPVLERAPGVLRVLALVIAVIVVVWLIMVFAGRSGEGDVAGEVAKPVGVPLLQSLIAVFFLLIFSEVAQVLLDTAANVRKIAQRQAEKTASPLPPRESD